MTNQTKVVNEYLDLLNQAQDVMSKQADAITKGIDLRLATQLAIDLLVKLNTSGNLTDMIDQLNVRVNAFDELAIEYGKFSKTDYMQAVIGARALSDVGSESDG